MRKFFLPLSSLILAFLSLLTLKSIAPDLLNKQLLSFVLGFIGFYLAANIPFVNWKKFSLIYYILLCVVLLVLLIIGKTTRGISAWINLPGGFKLQPSQFAIPVTAIYLLYYLQNSKVKDLKAFIKILAIILLPALLIILQPDLGTALVYLASVGAVILLLKISFKYLASLFLIGLVTMIIAWTFILKDYQKSRITAFISGYEQESSASFNAEQSLIAVGSGKFLGRGLGFGVQSHLKFLPERQTDFIFASLAEEWGFLGSSFVVFIYFVMCLFLIKVSLDIDDFRLSLFCIIVAVMIVVQAGVNIGMNIGLLPITGITLPLLSYGGSSILAIFFMFGLVQSIINGYKKKIKLEIK